ncbi:MAG TPA: LysE family translocator, partial [Acidimicrobiales bacterium]|nr:LysE family translocator [Acidimicrobiales bacterium]
MPSPATLVLFAGAALVLLVIPGPAVLYIVARSAGQGRRAGLVSVAGVHTGTVVHVVAAGAGLSALLVASATAFTVVKLAGAGYLVWLGARILVQRRRAGPGHLPPVAARSMGRVYVDAVVLNVLNPKTAVFFLAFVPQFVDRARGDQAVQVLVLGALFILLGLASDGAYALAGAWAGRRLRRRPGSAPGLVAGTTYIGLGLVTAVGG